MLFCHVRVAIKVCTCARMQGAERRVPINYASRYRSSGDLARQSYLPFKVNATGVMPVIFSTSLLAVPGAIARFSGIEALQPAAVALAPGGPLYLPANVLFIIGINYYYTFLQLDPNDVSEQLKRTVRFIRQGISVPPNAVRDVHCLVSPEHLEQKACCLLSLKMSTISCCITKKKTTLRGMHL